MNMRDRILNIPQSHFKITKTLIIIFNIYRSPPLSSHSQPFSTFLNQFASFLSSASTTPHDFIIAGDLNIHVDDPHDSQFIQFQNLLDSTNLIQHLHIPKHKQGHTLDLLLTHVNSTLNPISFPSWSPPTTFLYSSASISFPILPLHLLPLHIAASIKSTTINSSVI